MFGSKGRLLFEGVSGMLEGFLDVLAILGIILLVILLIVILLVALILFSPISYRVEGKKQGEEMLLGAKVQYLLGMLRIRYVYPDPGKAVVKFLCFTIYEFDPGAEKSDGSKGTDKAADSKKSEKTDETNQQSLSGNEMSDAEKVSDPADPAAAEGALPQVLPQEESVTPAKESAHAPDDSANADAAENTDSANADTAENADSGSKIAKIKYTILGYCGTIKEIAHTIRYYWEIAKHPQTKQVVSDLLNRLWGILKHIRPRKIEANLVIGTGECDTTGYLCGIYGVFQPNEYSP
jgi:hypothetical protein